MTVYVVFDNEGFLIGVFSTEELARQYSDTITKCELDTKNIEDI